MKWIVYNLLFLISLIFLSPKFIRRMIRRGGYSKNFLQRFSLFGKINFENNSFNNKFWIHGVSVGEINLALELIKKIREKNSSIFFVISTNTSTAYKIIEKEKNKDDILIYFPLDIPFIIKNAFRKIHPDQLILVESELWPNLIQNAYKLQIPVHLINARISQKSYKKYSLFRFFTKDIVSKIETICVQSNEDLNRFIRLGAKKNSIHVVGSMKFDLIKDFDNISLSNFFNTTFDTVSEKNIFLMGVSTWPREESLLINVYLKMKKIFPKLVLIIAPRHVERSKSIEREIRDLEYNVIKRSDISVSKIYKNEIFLIDSTGELNSIYNEVDIAFIGKSLFFPNIGGQNIIEPALKKTALITGPYMNNFNDIISIFDIFNASIKISNENELELHLINLLENLPYMDDMKKKSLEACNYGKGALNKTLNYIKFNKI